MKVEAIQHKDVRDKIQFYLKITNNKGKTYLINVGLKTHDEILHLQLDEEDKPTEKIKK